MWVTTLAFGQTLIINGVRIQIMPGRKLGVLDKAEVIKLPVDKGPTLKPKFKRPRYEPKL